MGLVEAMQENPNKAEVTIFQTFVVREMSIQKQLDKSYHGNKFFRDRLLTSVDVPAIRDCLKDRIPRSSQQLINMVANRLPHQPRTASICSAHMIEVFDTSTSEAVGMYSLG